MRAVILDRTGPVEDSVLRLGEVDKPVAGPGEVVMKVSTCGVCHSNLHMIEGDWVDGGVPAFLPIIPGHEVVGVIDSLGPGVDWLHLGQRVGVQPLWRTCGHCEYCLSGEEQRCQDKDITGETVHGGYAEYMLAKALHCYPVPDEIGDVEAAPLFCPGITAYSAVFRASLSPGKRVAVFGIGGVGHMVLEFAVLTGAEVIAVTRSVVHGNVASTLGINQVINAAEVDAVDAIKTMGGVDASIVFAPADEVVRQAIDATKPGGTVVVGVQVDLGRFLFADEKKIVGSVIGPRHRMNDVLKLAAQGRVKPVCDVFSLEEAPDVLSKLKHGEIRARAVLKI